MKCPNCYALQEEIENLKKKIIQLEKWKGKDEMVFEKDRDNWTVVNHIKDKETLKVKTEKHVIAQSNVDYILHLIDIEFKLTNFTTSKAVAQALILDRNLSLNLDEFWGGKNRVKYYFPFYYSLKILEYLKKINYSGRGKITKGNNY